MVFVYAVPYGRPRQVPEHAYCVSGWVVASRWRDSDWRVSEMRSRLPGGMYSLAGSSIVPVHGAGRGFRDESLRARFRKRGVKPGERFRDVEPGPHRQTDRCHRDDHVEQGGVKGVIPISYLDSAEFS